MIDQSEDWASAPSLKNLKPKDVFPGNPSVRPWLHIPQSLHDCRSPEHTALQFRSVVTASLGNILGFQQNYLQITKYRFTQILHVVYCTGWTSFVTQIAVNRAVSAAEVERYNDHSINTHF